MNPPPSRRRPPLGLVLALGMVMLTAGSAAAWFAWRAIAPPPPATELPGLDPAQDSPIPTHPENARPTVATPLSAPGQVYWLEDDASQLILVPTAIPLPEADNPEAFLKATFKSLLAGPGAAVTAATTIPEATQLLGLTIAADGIHIDLSAAFTTGGGSAAMIGRLAQVVYTATGLAPEAPVWIAVEGKPLTLLGGEGIEVRQPMTRAHLAADFDMRVKGQ